MPVSQRILARTSAVVATIAALLVLGGSFLLFAGSVFACFDSCPTKDQLYSTLAHGWMFSMGPGVVAGTVAWLLCIVYLARREERRLFVLALLTPPVLAVILAAAAFSVTTLPVHPEGVLVETPLYEWEHFWAVCWGVVLLAWCVEILWLVRARPAGNVP